MRVTCLVGFSSKARTVPLKLNSVRCTFVCQMSFVRTRTVAVCNREAQTDWSQCHTTRHALLQTVYVALIYRFSHRISSFLFSTCMSIGYRCVRSGEAVNGGAPDVGRESDLRVSPIHGQLKTSVEIDVR